MVLSSKIFLSWWVRSSQQSKPSMKLFKSTLLGEILLLQLLLVSALSIAAPFFSYFSMNHGLSLMFQSKYKIRSSLLLPWLAKIQCCECPSVTLTEHLFNSNTVLWRRMNLFLWWVYASNKFTKITHFSLLYFIIIIIIIIETYI